MKQYTGDINTSKHNSDFIHYRINVITNGIFIINANGDGGPIKTPTP